ncbi:YihY/virulence factor BrkB family protein [Guyparkeria hydrothermalis]|uniref:YihY/virulence factor BrkB family protein n=1 Tax=Guyparkeria hydrothermalis TaxID=923 RepID=UPI00202154C6|nr:YihY/virulence factor BrkB family protein [Guyparkeria hydrothermalis]MCL7744202.1 YihY/virulence factor BrkB family protein [Guyparkeria hydrothermalis]
MTPLKPSEWIRPLKRWIWHDRPTGRLSQFVQRLTRAFLNVMSSASRGDLQLNAMSLSYTTLLSMVPLLAVTFSVLKAFGSASVIEPFLLSLLAPLGDAADELTLRILSFVDNIRVGVLGAVGVALLFYTVIALMQKIERVFNRIWHVHQMRSMSARFANYLSVLMVGPVLVIAAGSLTATLLAAPVIRDFAALSILATMLKWLGYLVPLAIWTGAFAFLYLFIPNTRVKASAALVGGLVAAVLWNLLGLVFGGLIAGSTSYTAVYSAFASLVLFLVWLQIAWMIVLIGAGISYGWQHSDRLSLGDEEGTHPSQRLAAAIVLLDEIERRFEAGQLPPDRDQLAERVGRYRVLAEVWIDPLLEKLVEAELLRVTESDDATCFLPARPGSAISLEEIENAIEGHAPELPAALLREIPALARFGEHHREWQAELGRTSLSARDQSEASSDDAPRQ